MPNLKTWIAIALTLGAASALGGCQKKAGESPRQQARAISVVAVAPREIEGGLIASGALIPREDIAVFPQLTGYRAARLLVDVGARVAAGQPLVELDDTLLRAQLAQQTALAAQQTALADQADAQDYRRAAPFRALCASLGVDPALLAHRYALGMDGVATVVIGVKNRAELAQCLQAEALGPLPADLVGKIDSLGLGDARA